MTHGQAQHYRVTSDAELTSLWEAASNDAAQSPKWSSHWEKARVKISVIEEEQARRRRLSNHERIEETRRRLIAEDAL